MSVNIAFPANADGILVFFPAQASATKAGLLWLRLREEKKKQVSLQVTTGFDKPYLSLQKLLMLWISGFCRKQYICTDL